MSEEKKVLSDEELENANGGLDIDVIERVAPEKGAAIFSADSPVKQEIKIAYEFPILY